MGTYTQTDGDADGTRYFQNVEISPATVADGSLLQRLDTKRYPELGDDEGVANAGAVPTVTVTASNDAPLADTDVVLTARVTSALASVRPTGTVTFKDGASTIGTGVLAAGVATLDVPGGFTDVTHHITAVYPGDKIFHSATSPIHDVVAAPNAATVAVTASNDAPAAGADVVLTATVNHNDATGTATFKDGVTTLGTGAVIAGVATFDVAAGFLAGTHHITAVYTGDTKYAGATSPIHDVVAA